MPARPCATLPEAIAYVRERWNDRDMPLRLHDHATGDDGAPRLAARFLRYLDAHAYSTVEADETVACYHPRIRAADDPFTCPDCSGMGVKTQARTRYLWPMWAALARLAKVPPVLDYQPAPVLVVLTLAHCGWDWHIAAERLDLAWHHDGGEAIILLSLRKLADRYAEGPIPRVGWVSKSEAQRSAEMVGAA